MKTVEFFRVTDTGMLETDDVRKHCSVRLGQPYTSQEGVCWKSTSLSLENRLRRICHINRLWWGASGPSEASDWSVNNSQYRKKYNEKKIELELTI